MDLDILLQSLRESLAGFTLSLVMAGVAILLFGLLARVAERWGF